MATKTTETLTTFSASRDENGQQMTGNPADKAVFDDRLGQLSAEPAGDSETAMLASGFTSDDATEATEAETPAEHIAQIGDASLPTREGAAAAIERATAGLGKSGKP